MAISFFEQTLIRKPFVVTSKREEKNSKERKKRRKKRRQSSIIYRYYYFCYRRWKKKPYFVSIQLLGFFFVKYQFLTSNGAFYHRVGNDNKQKLAQAVPSAGAGESRLIKIDADRMSKHNGRRGSLSMNYYVFIRNVNGLIFFLGGAEVFFLLSFLFKSQ